MRFEPYNSDMPPRWGSEVYVVLLPYWRDKRPAVLLGRDYGCVGTVPRREAIDLMRSARVTSHWRDYTGGERPEGFAADEPLNGVWLDAAPVAPAG